MKAGMMATVVVDDRKRPKPISVDRYERFLAYASMILLAAALTAILRGRAEWSTIPALIWFHLATILAAVALTPIMLLRRRGDGRHRLLGRIWVAAMFATALISLGIRVINPGHWSWIHLLSALVIVQAPMIWWTARTHRLQAHRRAVRGMVTGALLIAGFFTFPFGRLLGHWLLA
jgi:uncharacterized membrane protein